jgi:putative Holliday junction resolvase
MRILGVDYGDRHIGLALSDPLLITAQPLASYELTGNEKDDRAFFQELVARHDIGEIVVGNPLRLDALGRGLIDAPLHPEAPPAGPSC